MICPLVLITRSHSYGYMINPRGSPRQHTHTLCSICSYLAKFSFRDVIHSRFVKAQIQLRYLLWFDSDALMQLVHFDHLEIDLSSNMIFNAYLSSSCSTT
eukprot:938107_1